MKTLSFSTFGNGSGMARRRNLAHQSASRPIRAAFTLIELLVVIAIIAILAALIVGATGRAGESKVRKRVQTELQSLVGAIENYKSKLGYFPQDNSDTAKLQWAPLYYELTGINIPGSYLTDFNVKGTANTSIDGQKPRNFLPTLKPSAYSVIKRSGTDEAILLTVPYKGPTMIPAADGSMVNPWFYRLTNPVHNPDSFDLWAEVDVGGKKITIGNWTE